jgi:hypothetical protein
MTYSQWLAWKQVAAMTRTHATQDRVTEGETAAGGRFKRVRDQLGHEVIQRTEPDGSEHQDVVINMGGPGGDL